LLPPDLPTERRATLLDRADPLLATAWLQRLASVIFDEMEAALRERLEALPPAARAELIHVIRLLTSNGPTRSALLGPP